MHDPRVYYHKIFYIKTYNVLNLREVYEGYFITQHMEVYNMDTWQQKILHDGQEN